MTRLTSARTSRVVSPLELFFDLVFVFAVFQLSHHLLDHLTWQGAAEAAVLLVAVYCVWVYAGFEATLLNPEAPRQGWVILAAMLVGLIMSAAAIGRAFTDNSWTFVIPLLVIQFGHGLVGVFSASTPGLRTHYVRMTIWLLAGGALWVTGAADGEDTRLLWWGAAAVLDLAGTWLAHPWPGHLRSKSISSDAAYMVERCQLFLIIAVGEAILITGTKLSAEQMEPPVVLAGALAFITIIALWALYLGGSDRPVSDRAKITTDPIRAARMAINGLVVAVAGLVALAVGHQTVIHDPQGETTTEMVLLLFGGPALFVLTQAWALRELSQEGWPARIAAAAGLGITGAIARFALPPLAASLLVALVLVGLLTPALQHESTK